MIIRAAAKLNESEAEDYHYMEQDYSSMQKISCSIVDIIKFFQKSGQIKCDKGFLLEYTMTAVTDKGEPIILNVHDASGLSNNEVTSLKLYMDTLRNPTIGTIVKQGK